MLRWSVISPTIIIQADAEQVAKHGDGVPLQAHTRLWRVVPDHRHFPDAKTELTCQIEHLDIEAEPLGGHTFANGQGCLPPEALKPALCIKDARNSELPYDRIEEAPKVLSITGLVYFDARTRQGTRTDGDVTGLIQGDP